MHNIKIKLPPLAEENIVIGTRDQLLEFYKEKLKSREIVYKELFKLQSEFKAERKLCPTMPTECHIIGKYKCAFEFEKERSICNQLDLISILPPHPPAGAGKTSIGIFGSIFYCRFNKFTDADVEDGIMGQVDLSVRNDYILLRPDNYAQLLQNYFDKAVEGSLA